MTLLHMVLGGAVLLLCAAAGVLGLLRRTGPREQAVTAWALGLLVIQAATGMFLLTATESATPVHILVPFAGLAAVLVARTVKGDARAPAAGAAYLFAALASVVAFVTGLAS